MMVSFGWGQPRPEANGKFQLISVTLDKDLCYGYSFTAWNTEVSWDRLGTGLCRCSLRVWG